MRNPPHNIEAERSVLGAVLLKPTAIDEVSAVLRADDMFIPAHREILGAMLDLQAARTPIDVITLAEGLKRRCALAKLEGGEAYLPALANAVPTGENVGHYLKIVQGKARLRALIGIAAELQSRAYADETPAEEIAEATLRAIGEATRGQDGKLIHISDALAEALEAIEARGRADGKPIGIPWGIGMLDRLTGGVHRKRMAIVAARPGVGKTALASNIVTRAGLRGIPCLVFELEMPAADIAERSLVYDARVDSGDLQMGKVDFERWKVLRASEKRLARCPIEFFQGTATIAEIQAVTRRWRARTPDVVDADGIQRQPLVVVDYLGRIKASSQGENRQAEVAYFSNALKDLALDLDIAMLALAQLNRDCEREGRKPRKSDLRDSGGVEQDADSITFIHDEYDPPEPTTTRTVMLAKNRYGACAEDEVAWVARYMALSDKADEDRVAPPPNWQDQEGADA